MRAGFIASGVGHGALLLGALVLLAGPKPFVTVPPDAITVDIIGADAIPSGDATRQPWAESAAAPEPSGRDREQQPAPDPAENPQSRTASAPPQPSLRQEQRASREPAQTRPAQPEPPSLLVYNPTVAPVQELPLPGGGAENAAEGFDAPADAAAKLSREEVATLRAHLQKCWNPPAAIADAQKLKVVLRVSFKPNGALTGSPVLLEASASAHGPALGAAATSALRQCQPYSFLPAGKYQEWKLLDLSFSPGGMSGG